jgi:hypothetical protein
MPPTHHNSIVLNFALAALLVALGILSLMIGPAPLSPSTVMNALFGADGPAGVIVRDIRLPRTLLAILIGATLGISGAALQGLLRNALAAPELYGAPQRPRPPPPPRRRPLPLGFYRSHRSPSRLPVSRAHSFRSAGWSPSPDGARA